MAYSDRNSIARTSHLPGDNGKRKAPSLDHWVQGSPLHEYSQSAQRTVPLMRNLIEIALRL